MGVSKKRSRRIVKRLCAIGVFFLITGITLSGNSMKVTALPETLKEYESPRYGLNFFYPSEWAYDELGCEYPTLIPCGIWFTLWSTIDNVSVIDTFSTGDVDNIVALGYEEENLLLHMIDITYVELDRPSLLNMTCNCNTLKDFVIWDFIRTHEGYRKYINSNQTQIGTNHSAWQAEYGLPGGKKELNVYAINGNAGYRFTYEEPFGNDFDRYLDDFRNMLKSVTLSTPIREENYSVTE